jgi:hypothetical protein
MSFDYNPEGERPGRRLNLDDSSEPTGRTPLVTVGSHSLDKAIAAVYAAMMLADSRSRAVTCWHALRPLIEARFRPEEG